MPKFTGKEAKYNFLYDLDPLPRMITEALALYDTREIPGPQHNPRIMGWVQELALPGVTSVYTADEVPWCGLFIAVVAKRAAKTPVKNPLWALNWGNFGTEAGQPMLGDVLTFIRPGGGHVALYVGESKTSYHVIGGNQGNRVCFTEIGKERLRAARRPLYMNQPATVRTYMLNSSGEFSTDEG